MRWFGSFAAVLAHHAVAVGVPRRAPPHLAPRASTVATEAPLDRDAFDAVVQSTYGRYPVTIVRGRRCELEDDRGANGIMVSFWCIDMIIWNAFCDVKGPNE